MVPKPVKSGSAFPKRGRLMVIHGQIKLETSFIFTFNANFDWKKKKNLFPIFLLFRNLDKVCLNLKQKKATKVVK